ncbi:flavin-dependent dehydrogenase [Anabaena sp. FACHB-1237]|uniref:NAD(P)/FAD-dependent oxidoreductase n=1 Tax=Anabaena sp. FACHB-1237 TaxID=2692769 RepID=UPI001680874E|nr:flavin-dependent dehydrogenase [Anabaena sp. FACHB-1237]MBD2137157.1 flavin-dependent dehydrogenase [Anabaena sp. FACHB-1237]
MQELLYLEIPTPDTAAVCNWLHDDFIVENCEKLLTPHGFRLRNPPQNSASELSLFVWQLQRTTYLKVFRWGKESFSQEKTILKNLTQEIRNKFPHEYPQPPIIDSQKSIFTELEKYYPLTVKYFQKMPNGEYDLNRAYWWEKKWREGVNNPQEPRQVIFNQQIRKTVTIDYDIIYIGGALGSIHAAVMAKLGYKVLLIERLPFGKMNREWNISREEIQSLVKLGLLTNNEVETIISREYIDGFNKFFDANNPDHLKSPILHTPTVLNIALNSEKLLQLCGEKLIAAGGKIWDETEFIKVDVDDSHINVYVENLPDGDRKQVTGRLLIDAMGTASPIAWQLNGNRAFDSVCPTVGAVIESGFEPGVWDNKYGDVLNSHGDISRGRQLIWELFPGENEELTIYLFHYHQVNAKNPGSLLEMYEDFFTILPEYRRCDVDKLVWKKPTFGYIPGHFSTSSSDRTIAYNRIMSIGDAASLQSPLVFTGFGSLVRNLERLTTLLNVALKHDLLDFQNLNKIRAFQSNIAVTWLFSKGMMVPTDKFIAPQTINSMLNTFFGLLAAEPSQIANNFIKDRFNWLTFNRLALQAAIKNPTLLLWIWQLAGWQDLLRWLANYVSFTSHAIVKFVLGGWLPQFVKFSQDWLENRFPSFWLRLLAINYAISVDKPIV